MKKELDDNGTFVYGCGYKDGKDETNQRWISLIKGVHREGGI